KSVGASVYFDVEGYFDAEGKQEAIEVFTTRVDTIYGVSFIALAPEHDFVNDITTSEQQLAVQAYQEKAKRKTELERMSETKTVSGVFTGSYARHPLTGQRVPIWIADYVLAGYGTGAVMAVPSGDQRDYLFAKHFDLPIVAILDQQDISEAADTSKEGKYINSDLINGMRYAEAVPLLLAKLEEIGKGK